MTVGTAIAQERTTPSHDQSTNGGVGARTGHVTSSGETVPHPGASQSAGTTSIDRGVMKNDDAIQNGICKGC